MAYWPFGKKPLSFGEEQESKAAAEAIVAYFIPDAASAACYCTQAGFLVSFIRFGKDLPS